jgi:exopolysaccharide biosynthesis polyprenyl glycosylphosphotransferase
MLGRAQPSHCPVDELEDHSGMIPRRLFWVFDLCGFLLAFSVAYRVTPAIVPLVDQDGPFSLALRWARPPWPGQLPPPQDHIWILITVCLTGVMLLGTLGAHRNLLDQSIARILVACIVAPVAGLSLITLVLFALKSPEWSRVFIFSFVGLSSVGLATYRLLLRTYCVRRLRVGAYARNILLVGPDDLVGLLADLIARSTPRGEYHIVGYLRTGTLPPVADRADFHCLGSVELLNTLLIRRPIREVVVAQPAHQGVWLTQVVHECDQVGIPLRIVPAQLMRTTLETLRPLYPELSMRLPAVVLSPPHVDSDALFVKRLIDLTISGLLLALLAPLMVLIAIAVKLSSPGPIFYRWHVIGRHGYEFTGFKFRTMVRDADARKADLLARNEMTGPVFKLSKDPRVTPVGRVLRKYSLDELPQLWSVLKGDMSLVGPRPAFRSELDRYEFWQMRKLSTRPGITCLWQVRGRSRITEFDDWVKMDLEYIDNWSLWLDCKILARTAWAVLAGTGR